MNIKRLFSFVLVLIMFVPAAYAANDSFGTITDLQLQRRKIAENPRQNSRMFRTQEGSGPLMNTVTLSALRKKRGSAESQRPRKISKNGVFDYYFL